MLTVIPARELLQRNAPTADLISVMYTPKSVISAVRFFVLPAITPT